MEGLVQRIFVDKGLGVLESNGTLLNSLGVVNDIKKGDPCSKAFGEFWRSGYAKNCREVIRTGRSAHKESAVRLRSNRQCLLDVTIEPLMENDSTVGAILIVRDVTAIKKTTQQEMLKGKMSNLSLLAANIAHKLNNPLAAILNRIGCLLMEDAKNIDATRLRSELQAIQEQIYAMSIITNALEAFSRDSTAHFKNLDINNVLQKAIELSRLLHLHNKNVVYKIKLAQSLPRVFGNEITLEQCFINIIRNALEAMPEGGILSIKTLFDDAAPEQVKISIKDTGVGIPRKNLDIVYDPFFTDKGGDHSGLGLSISYGIIANHNGNIEIQSKENKGTVISILLPVTKSEKGGGG